MPTDKQPRRFKLLKDLPITLAGTIFIPKETGSSTYKPENGGWLEEVPEELVTGCPLWFEEVKEQPLTVISLINTCADADNVTYELKLSKMLPPNSGHIVSQAIEYVLNGELPDDMVLKMYDKIMSEKSYSQEEVDTIRRDTWEAARELRVPYNKQGHPFNTYPTFEDYLKSLDQPQTTNRPIQDKEWKCTCKMGEPFNNLCCPIHGLIQPTPPPTVVKNKVLFTTEDGVEITERDGFWWVNKELRLFWVEVADGWNKPNELKVFLSNNKTFSTEKAAKNHIKCNAKLLSFNDVWNLSDNKSTDKAYVVINKNDLTKLVKEKLKQ